MVLSRDAVVPKLQPDTVMSEAMEKDADASNRAGQCLVNQLKLRRNTE